MAKLKKKQEIFIVLISILVVLILGLLIWAIQIKKILPRAAQTATLALSPSSGNLIINQNTNINVVLNTSGNTTDGVDIMIRYSPTYLDIVDQDAGTAGIQIKPGTIYPNYVGNSVDTVNGVIKLSGFINPTDAGYNGTATFATIVVKGKATVASTSLQFNFVSGQTQDNTNVIEHVTGNDVLLSVTNGSYAVVANAPSTPTSLTATPAYDRVTLSWTASTAGTFPIAGYSIYRGTASGGESPTALANVTVTNYTDTSVTHGVNYYYIVKAYDNQTPANYSGPSNEVSATLTPPTLTIQITLQRRTNGTTSNAQVKVYAQGNTTNVLAQKTFSTGSNGQASVTVDLDAGTYDFYVHANNYLSKKLTVSMAASGATLNFATLEAADLNNDDVVNSADFSLIVAAWFSADPIADINADGVVNTADYSVMVNNWFHTGVMPK